MAKNELDLKLEEECLSVLDELKDISSMNEEYEAAVNNLSKLVEMKNKQESLELEDKSRRKDFVAKLASTGADVFCKVFATGIGVYMFVRGMYFEEHGSFTSFVFKDSLKRLLKF